VLITAEANSRTVAEHVFALALAVFREIPKWDRLTRAGGPDLHAIRELDLAHDLSEKRLGIVGIGRIGTEVARIGRDGFLMDVLAYHPTRSDDEIRSRGAEPTRSLSELLGRVDLVSLQVPLSDETRGMMGAEQFRQMTPQSVLVNVSRGGIVDETALAEALRSGTIAGAGIDVWERHVPRQGHPLLGLDHVVVSPHRAGRTEEAQRRMGMTAVRALLDTLAGREPVGVANVSRG
jgi:D-3-phosphoglycerate dehydrogenase